MALELPELGLSLELELTSVQLRDRLNIGGETSLKHVRNPAKGLSLYADTDQQVVAFRKQTQPWVLVPYANVASMEVYGKAGGGESAAEEKPASKRGKGLFK